MQRTPYSTADSTADSRAAVYLIHRKDRQRFKVGWSSNPVTRAQSLPEFRLAQLDLRHSLALWLPSRQRAQQVEQALHKGLAPFQAQAGHTGDGHSEWFASPALPAAVRLLHQMPGDGSAFMQRPLLGPFLPELAARDLSRCDIAPQALWFDIEDLWLRLSRSMPVQAEAWDGTTRLHFGPPRVAFSPQEAELMRRAADVDGYGWRTDGERGSFIRVLVDEGNRLVLTLASPAAISRWPEGEELRWQVQGFVARMRAMQGPESIQPTALFHAVTTHQHGGNHHVPSR